MKPARMIKFTPILLILMFLTSPPLEAEDEPKENPIVTRFMRVEKWVGSISSHETSVTHKSSGGLCGDQAINSRADWSFSMKGAVAGGPNTNAWVYRHNEPDSGKFDVSCSYTDVRKKRSTWHGLDWRGGCSGTCQEHSLSISLDDDEKGTYSIFASGASSQEKSRWVRLARHEMGAGWQRFPGSAEGQTTFGALTDSRPIPRSLNLSGSHTTREVIKGDDCSQTVKTETVSWNFRPDKLSSFEVEVEIKDYEDWLPRGGPDGATAGGKLQVIAHLKNDKGGESKETPEKFVFELLATSQERGVAMNWPVKGAGTEYDLRFEENENPGFEIKDADGQRAETQKEGTEASVAISSFDWGAHAFLRVTAVMKDGEEVEGRLKGAGDAAIPVPWRENGSDIAAKWKKDHGVTGLADADDDENAPPSTARACRGHKGDGLTLYEEYRGFYAKNEGGHFCGDPKRKDYFIVNKLKGAAKAAAEQGIDLFRSETKLNVHGKLSEDEVDERMINFNHTDAPSSALQHAVVLEADPGVSYAAANGGPGTPGNITSISVGTGFHPGDWNIVTRGKAKIMTKTFPVMIAHELLHAANVWHHGDRDRGWVRWEAQKFGAYYLVWEFPIDAETGSETGAGKIVTVFAENGRQLNPELFIKPRTVYVGNLHGQHSGFEDCLMRYDVASAYDPDFPRGGTRYLSSGPKEITGIELCRVVTGTGVNDPARQPRPRFRDADRIRDRGHCQTHVCVNDLYTNDHPNRSEPGDYQ